MPHPMCSISYGEIPVAIGQPFIPLTYRLRAQSYNGLQNNKQDRRISPTSRIATLNDSPSTAGYTDGPAVQSQTMTQTVPRVTMACTGPPEQRPHNSSGSPTGPPQLQPGPSGRGNGRVTNLLNMQSTTFGEQAHSSQIKAQDLQTGALSNLRTMMGSQHGHSGPGLSGQNLHPYNQNAFSQQYPSLVNSALSLHDRVSKKGVF